MHQILYLIFPQSGRLNRDLDWNVICINKIVSCATWDRLAHRVVIQSLCQSRTRYLARFLHRLLWWIYTASQLNNMCWRKTNIMANVRTMYSVHALFPRCPNVFTAWTSHETDHSALPSIWICVHSIHVLVRAHFRKFWLGKAFFSRIWHAVVLAQFGNADSKSAPCQAIFCVFPTQNLKTKWPPKLVKMSQLYITAWLTMNIKTSFRCNNTHLSNILKVPWISPGAFAARGKNPMCNVL